MNPQEFEGVNKIKEGAIDMIKSLENLIKNNYSNIGEEGAKKLAEAMNSFGVQEKIKEFKKELNDLNKWQSK
jgi:ATP-dependent helicase/DNAse subunit B